MMAAVVNTFEHLENYYHPVLRKKYNLPVWTPQAPQAIETETVSEIGWMPIPNHAVLPDKLKKPAHHLALDNDWPARLESPLAWKGEEFHDSAQYVYQLDQSEIKEIKDALSYFKSLQLRVEEARKTTFPLPHLQETLEQLSSEVHEGKGFFILRGLDPFSFTKEENVILYLGISSYVAEQRGRQRVDGRMLTHIVDATFTVTPREKRQPAYSNVEQPFHADVFCEVLALYSLNTAAYGGKSKIASSWTVYNELASTRPDILHTLAKDDWVHHTFQYTPPWYRRPLLFCEDGKPILNFSRRMITGNSVTPRPTNAPPITAAQAEALDAVHFLAQKHCLETTIQPGDMRFINNLSILHARDAYEDVGESRRYLLRLWLRNNEKGWAIPKGLQLVWDRIFSPIDDIEEYWEIEPFEKEKDGDEGNNGGTSTGKSSDCG